MLSGVPDEVEPASASVFNGASITDTPSYRIADLGLARTFQNLAPLAQ